MRLPGRKVDLCELCVKFQVLPLGATLVGPQEGVRGTGSPGQGQGVWDGQGRGPLEKMSSVGLPCPPTVSPSCPPRPQHPNFNLGTSFFLTLSP